MTWIGVSYSFKEKSTAETDEAWLAISGNEVWDWFGSEAMFIQLQCVSATLLSGNSIIYSI